MNLSYKTISTCILHLTKLSESFADQTKGLTPNEEETVKWLNVACDLTSALKELHIKANEIVANTKLGGKK